jgi:hypothetical protein
MDSIELYTDFLEGEVQEILQEYYEKGLHPPALRKRQSKVYDVKKELGVPLQEKIVGLRRCEELRKESARLILEKKLILLDMPDYNKYNPSSMNKDFEELQKFWYDLQFSQTSFVIAMQKELVMRNPHFFIGKMNIMELKPLSTDDLLAAYKFITKDSEVFSDDALRLLAEFSRGIFRRFKKYINLTIENNLNENVPLKPEHVNKAITKEILFEDMELELTELFKEREKRVEAVSVLNFLRINSNVNVKTLADSLNLTETVMQKLIRKLDTHGYISLSRGKGKELLISLRQILQ